jgi:phage baseplate assembly protein W
MTTQISFPFEIARTGELAEADDISHIEQMIEQLLFTRPGERVNRPDFGCGLFALVFETANSELAVATQALVRGSLVRWLGDLIHIEALTVETDDSRLVINVSYAVLRTQVRRSATFTQ